MGVHRPDEEDRETADEMGEGLRSEIEKLTEEPNPGTAEPGDHETEPEEPSQEPEPRTESKPTGEDDEPEPKDQQGDEDEVSPVQEAIRSITAEGEGEEKPKGKEEGEKPTEPTGDDDPDSPEQSAADEEWRKTLNERTGRRFDRLLDALSQSKEEVTQYQERLQSYESMTQNAAEALTLRGIEADKAQELLQASLEDQAQLIELGLDPVEIQTAHDMWLMLKTEPEKGLDYLMRYAQEVARQTNTPLPGGGQAEPDLSGVELDEELGDLVNATYLEEDEAKLIAHLRAKKGNQEQQQGQGQQQSQQQERQQSYTPTTEQAPTQQADAARDQAKAQETAKLLTDFLIEKQVPEAELDDVFFKKIEPIALEMVKANGRDPKDLTPQEHLFYTTLAYDKAFPPKSTEQTTEASPPPPSASKGARRTTPRQAPGAQFSDRISQAIADVTAEE